MKDFNPRDMIIGALSALVGFLLALVLCSCSVDPDGLDPIDTPPVEVQCDSNEVLVAAPGASGGDGGTECAIGCANGLHCWSGCCVFEPPGSPSEGRGVCRPENICFGDK